MENKTSKTQKSFGRKCLERLSAITLALLPGCVSPLEAYTVTPEVGRNMPAGMVLESGSSYGARAGFRTKDGGEIGFGQNAHSASYVGTQDKVNTNDLSLRFGWPLFNGDGSQGSGKLCIFGEVVRRNEVLNQVPGKESYGVGLGFSMSGTVGPGELGGEFVLTQCAGALEPESARAQLFYKLVCK